METYQKLQEKLGDLMQEDVELKQYSTFKLGGPAKYFFIAKTREDIIRAVQIARELGLKFFILGGGSNILVSDSGFDGLVIKAENRKLEVRNNVIKAEAGVLLGKVVSQAMLYSLTGMEWAVGIPGTVGGAVRGNCGAYGKSTSDVVKKVEIYKLPSPSGRGVGGEGEMTKEECQFDYRESIFKKDSNLIVLGAEFKLEKGDKEEMQKQVTDFAKQRVSTQPKYPSSGCSFKNIIITKEIKQKLEEINPEIKSEIKGGKIGTAWFIDRAGLKGKQIGGVKVSDEHANFIVKCSEDAKADDVVQLISYVKQQVRTKFNVQLQEEIQYIGFN